MWGSYVGYEMITMPEPPPPSRDNKGTIIWKNPPLTIPDSHLQVTKNEIIFYQGIGVGILPNGAIVPAAKLYVMPL